MQLVRCASAWLILLVGSCADGGDSTSRCEAACERDDMCNLNPASPFCDDECEGDLTSLRADFAGAYLECYAALRCDVDGTECEVEASGGVDRRTLDDQFQTACQSAHATCDEAFSSDFCFQSHYYEQEAVDAAGECLTLPCDMIQPCLRRELPFAPFDR